jgi:L-fuconolactonase
MTPQALPIIDAHLHLWDPKRLRYPWLDAIPSLNRPFLLEDYRAATGTLPIEAMVLIQCEASPDASEAEAAWVAALARAEPRIKGLVAWAPLEKGSAVEPYLERLKKHSVLRGIRRIIQFEPDLAFCLRLDFIEGVRMLKDFDLSFDICIDCRQLKNVIRLAEEAPEVSMVLDHIGKPAIGRGPLEPWAGELRELARLPHVFCKISGVATEADLERWTSDELKRYIEVAIDAFGFDRILFGSDWPVATQAIRYQHWVDLLNELLLGVDEKAREAFWRGNAARFYRL